MFAVKFSEHLMQTPGLYEELDQLIKRLSAFLAVSFNDDGTLANATSVTTSVTTPTVVASSAAQIGGASAAATTARVITKKVTGIADNTATAVLTVTVPNGNHAGAIRLLFLSSNGSTDAFESSRCAHGLVVLARTVGANVVATAAAIADAAIATVSAGATHTLAYAVSAVSGAAAAPNTFTVTVTVDDSGNVGGSQVVLFAELLNSEASGITIS